MASPDDKPPSIQVAVCVDGRDPYKLFEVVELTASKARLRGPLMLERGEQLSLKFTRAGRSAVAEGKIVEVARGDGHTDPVTTVEIADDAALAPLGLRPEA